MLSLPFCCQAIFNLMDMFKQTLLGHTRQNTALEEICFIIESTGFMRVRRTELFIVGRNVETGVSRRQRSVSEATLTPSDNFFSRYFHRLF
jgi:hypothetical protein